MDVFLKTYLPDRGKLEHLCADANISIEDQTWKEMAINDTRVAVAHILNSHKANLENVTLNKVKEIARNAWRNVAQIYKINRPFEDETLLEAIRRADTGDNTLKVDEIIADAVVLTLKKNWDVTSFSQIPLKLIRKHIVTDAENLATRAYDFAFPYTQAKLEDVLDRAMSLPEPWHLLTRELHLHPLLSIVIIWHAMTSSIDRFFHIPPEKLIGLCTRFGPRQNKPLSRLPSITLESIRPQSMPRIFIKIYEDDGMYIGRNKLGDLTPTVMVLLPNTDKRYIAFKDREASIFHVGAENSFELIARFSVAKAPEWLDAQRDSEQTLIVIWGGRNKNGEASWAEMSALDPSTLIFSEADSGRADKMFVTRMQEVRGIDLHNHGNLLAARVHWSETEEGGFRDVIPITMIGYNNSAILVQPKVEATAIWGVPADFYIWDKKNRERARIVQGKLTESIDESGTVIAVAPFFE